LVGHGFSGSKIGHSVDSALVGAGSSNKRIAVDSSRVVTGKEKRRLNDLSNFKRKSFSEEAFKRRFGIIAKKLDDLRLDLRLRDLPIQSVVGCTLPKRDRFWARVDSGADDFAIQVRDDTNPQI
jgi:hypothetical protein